MCFLLLTQFQNFFFCFFFTSHEFLNEFEFSENIFPSVNDYIYSDDSGEKATGGKKKVREKIRHKT